MGSIRSHFNKLKETLAPMPWKKRLEYLGTYYLWVPIVLLVLILAAASIIPSVLESRKEVLFGGMYVNIPLSEEGQTILTEELFTHLGGSDHSRQKVTLTRGSVNPDSEDIYAAYAETTTIAAQITARELDYILMDEVAKDYFAAHEITGSLEDLLTARQLEALRDRLVYREGSNGSKYPFAIDLTGTPFAAACGMTEAKLYVAFPGNTDRAERATDFVDYLLDRK